MAHANRNGFGLSTCVGLVGIVADRFLGEGFAGLLLILGVVGAFFFGIRWLWEAAGRPQGTGPKLALLGGFVIAIAVTSAVAVNVYSQISAPPPAVVSPPEKLPTITDLTAELIVDAVVGDNVRGHLQISNGASQTVHIGTLMYEVLNYTMDDQEEPLPRTIPVGGHLSIPLAPKNGLATHEALRLQFDASFDKASPPKQPFFQFESPGGFKAGNYYPNYSGEKPVNLVAVHQRSALRIFEEANDFKGTFRESEGPVDIPAQEPGTFFVFDPKGREVVLAVMKGKDQTVLKANLRHTVDGAHVISASWRDKPKLTVDGIDAPVVMSSAGK